MGIQVGEEMEKEYLSVKELSELTGITTHSIYKLVKENKIRHLKIGSRIFLKLEDFVVEPEREETKKC